MPLEVGEPPAADDGEAPVEPHRETLQQARQLARHPDRVGRVGELDQSAVEIEEQGRAVEQRERRRRDVVGHGAALAERAGILKPAAARYTGAMPPPIRSAARFKIAYRPAVEDDLPFLAAVYASTRTDEIAQSGWPIELQHAFLRQQHEAQHAHYATVYPDAERLVIERDGSAVGRLFLVEWPGNLRIIDVSLLPEERGRGVGEAILRDIGADAASRGSKVSIHVEKFNPARRLYERLGFTLAEDKGVYDLMEWRPDIQPGSSA